MYVCGRSLHQPEYQILKHGFENNFSKNQVRSLFEHQDRISEESGGPINFIDYAVEDATKQLKGGVSASFYDDGTKEIQDPSCYDASAKNLLVLDDIMLDAQAKSESFFTRGRHNNIDVIYITQSYFHLPRQTIRENANILVFFKQDSKNLSHIYQDHCSIDGIPFDTFKDFCFSTWNKSKHHFITIDLTKPWDCGKYRRNLTEDYWKPSLTSCLPE